MAATPVLFSCFLLMLLLLPNELSICIYQEWIASIYDISALDIACCNHSMREKYLASLYGLCIDFHFGTSPRTSQADIFRFLSWIAYRQVHIAELTLSSILISAASFISAGSLHIKTFRLPGEINIDEKRNSVILPILHDILSRFASLTTIECGLVSDECLQMCTKALADCQTLSKVVLPKSTALLSDNSLVSFLNSYKDTLKDIELGSLRRSGSGELKALNACKKLESVKFGHSRLDRASVLDFCRQHPHLQKLCLKGKSDGSGAIDASFVEDVLLTCPLLHSLSVVDFDCILTADALNSVMDRFPKLRYLKVGNITIQITCTGTERSCAIETDANNIHLGSIIRQLPLPLHAFAAVTTPTTVYVQTDITNSALVRLVGDTARRSLRKLTHGFRWDNDNDSDYDDLIYTLQSCPHIEDFSLLCCSFGIEDLLSIIATLPATLRTLTLRHPKLKKKSYSALINAVTKHSLHSLHLLHWKLDADDILLEVVRLLPRLQILEISNCSYVKLTPFIEAMCLLSGTILLVDDYILDQLCLECRNRPLLRKLLRKGRVQAVERWRKNHASI